MLSYDDMRKDMDILVNSWEDAGKRVIELCFDNPLNISMNDFLKECTACGGNWGGMLLSGVKRLRPKVWEAIPDNMGTMAWVCICCVLELLGVQNEKAES